MPWLTTDDSLCSLAPGLLTRVWLSDVRSLARSSGYNLTLRVRPTDEDFFFLFLLPRPNMSRKRSIAHLLSSLKTAYAGATHCQSSLARTAAPSALSLRDVDEAGSARFPHVTRTYSTTKTGDKDTIHIADEVYNRQRSVLPLLNRIVHAAPSAYIAPSAVRLDHQRTRHPTHSPSHALAIPRTSCRLSSETWTFSSGCGSTTMSSFGAT